MTISVIIPTYNGAHKIEKVLKAIAVQTVQPDEVIVVVDGSTDNTVSVLNNQKVITNLKIVERLNGGRAAVRNTGAKEATSELLIFFDDDMVPTATCIQNHVEHHLTIKGSILTGAQVEVSEGSISDLQKYKAHLSNKWLLPMQSNEGKPLKKEAAFLTAANFSISKETFFLLEGFDERLKDAEDFDMAIRAFKKNIALYYKHAAFAWHDDPITAANYIRRLRQYKNAHQQLRIIKPKLYYDINQYSFDEPQGVKKHLFLAFAHKSWIEWMDRSSWKKIIPQFLRYRIYNMIITANGVYYPEKVAL